MNLKSVLSRYADSVCTCLECGREVRVPLHKKPVCTFCGSGKLKPVGRPV